MRFGVLGPLSARVAEREVRLNGPRQAKVLAALLVEANQVVTIQRMVDVMWDGEVPGTAVRQIQDAISGVRRNLQQCGAPPALISTHQRGYRIGLEPGQLDLLEFQQERQQADRLAAAGDQEGAAAALRRGLACWRGGALADLSSRQLEVEARRLDGYRTAARRQWLTLELALARHVEVAEELLSLVGEHPFDEGFVGQAMLALYRSGRQGEALELYRTTRRVLSEEIGVEPGPPLRELHRRILAADPSLAVPAPVVPGRAVPVGAAVDGPPVPRQLSAGLPDFTGRAAVVAQLGALLSGPSEQPNCPRVVSLVNGAGGVGKTSLAVHVAHSLLAEFPDGQLQADLRGVGGQPSNPNDVLARFLRALGTPPERIPADPDERAAGYRSAVAGQRILILLDNVHSAAQVRPLLPGSATCSVLITSRSTLPGLDGVRRFALDVLDEEEALALFTRIVGREAVEAEPEAVSAVLKVCAGLPLAIRLAASRLVARPEWTVGRLADRLGDERRRLGELAVEDRAVRASFAIGYRDLRPDEARAFRLLGLCEGPFVSLPAAAALFALPLPDAERLLAALTDVHLVQAPRAGCYQLHDLLRVYAAECAQEQEPEVERDAATHRLLSWYLHSSAAASRVLNPARRHVSLAEPGPEWAPLGFADHATALAWCESERTNLVAAVAQAQRTGRYEICWKLPITLWDLFTLRPQYEGRIECFEAALTGARALDDTEATGWVLNSLSSAYQAAGRLEEAADCLGQALEIRRRLGDTRGEASCHINLGYVYIELGQVARAVGVLELALAGFAAVGLRVGVAAAHGNLGEAHKQLGDFPSALEHFRQALAIDQEESDQFTVGRGLSNLAETLCLLGRYDEAAEYATLGRTTNQQAGNRVDEAVALDVLGRVNAAAGRRSLAEQQWEQARAIFTDLGSPRAAEVGGGS